MSIYYENAPAFPVPKEPKESDREYLSRGLAEIEENVRRQALTARSVGLGKTLLIVCCLGVVLLMSVFAVTSIAEVRARQNAVENNKKIYQQYQTENAILTMKIDKNTDYNAIYDYATEVLGMQIPTAEQMEYYRDHAEEYVLVEGIIPHD